MTINLKGVTRIVFVFRHVVVKIPKFYVQWDHFLKGIIGNIEEGRTWRYNSGKYERGTSYLLCPVIWTSWGGWILIMKRAEPLTRDQWDLVCNLLDEYQKYFAGDDTMNNYGILDSKLVKIDYADLGHYWGEDFKRLPLKAER